MSTYNVWAAAKDGLYAAHHAASAELKRDFGHLRGATGLLPDAVRTSPEYRQAKAREMRAFEAIRAFNSVEVPAEWLRGWRKGDPQL